MNNNFKILTCFTRSYDKHHNSDNLHLIASSVLVRDSLNLNVLNETLKDSSSNRKFIIVNVFDTNDEQTISEILSPEERKGGIEEDFFSSCDSDYAAFINISFTNLLKLYISNDTKDVIRDLFNYSSNYNESKSEDQRYTQCLFIFYNIKWSNIVLKFKINNIDISGGGTNTRHILTSSDIILTNYLYKMFKYDYDYVTELGFKTYKEEKNIMSGQIPIKLYKEYIDKLEEIFNLRVTTDDILNKIKLITKSRDPSDIPCIKIIANNLLISRDIIIKRMNLRIEKNLPFSYILNQLTKKRQEVQTLTEKLDIFESRTKDLPNKQKKILKKERTAHRD